MNANDTQVGGEHYKRNNGKMEHWDFTWENDYDQFQYIISKWIHRWRDKGGVEDLKKARHSLDKYIELVESQSRETVPNAGNDLKPWTHTRPDPLSKLDEHTKATDLQEQMRGYVKQG
jgi:hypothetical protein